LKGILTRETARALFPTADFLDEARGGKGFLAVVLFQE
jgi:hypothetical protein